MKINSPLFYIDFDLFCYSTWVDADKVDAVCGESYQCKYDYSTSLNMEFALFTKYYQDQFINIREGVLKPEARGKIIQIILSYLNQVTKNQIE